MFKKIEQLAILDSEVMILLTRFNNETYNENKSWRLKNQWPGCVYGSRTEAVDNWGGALVLEMNIETNCLIAIGIITETLPNPVRKPWRIHTSEKYNRYVYFGKERYQLAGLEGTEKKAIDILTKLLFTGKKHSKRGNHWRIPAWIRNNQHIDFEAELLSIVNKRKYT